MNLFTRIRFHIIGVKFLYHYQINMHIVLWQLTLVLCNLIPEHTQFSNSIFCHCAYIYVYQPSTKFVIESYTTVELFVCISCKRQIGDTISGSAIEYGLNIQFLSRPRLGNLAVIPSKSRSSSVANQTQFDQSFVVLSPIIYIVECNAEPFEHHSGS